MRTVLLVAVMVGLSVMLLAGFLVPVAGAADTANAGTVEGSATFTAAAIVAIVAALTAGLAVLMVVGRCRTDQGEL